MENQLIIFTIIKHPRSTFNSLLTELLLILIIISFITIICCNIAPNPFLEESTLIENLRIGRL